jgi:hypothetical protein
VEKERCAESSDDLLFLTLMACSGFCNLVILQCTCSDILVLMKSYYK